MWGHSKSTAICTPRRAGSGEPNPLTPYPGLAASRTMREYVSAVWITQSVLLCYGSPSKQMHMIIASLRNCQNVFQNGCAILYFHQQVDEDFSLPTSLLILVIVFFILVILVDKKWYFIVVLICISLWLIMLNILSCAYCMYLYHLEKFLFRFFAHFLIGWWVFDLFLLNYKVFI